MAKEPMCPEPDVHIMLPATSDALRGVVDRMKNIGNIITVSANLQGVLKLRVESDLAKVETEWRDLKHPEIGELLYRDRFMPLIEPSRFLQI
jgi:HUS1 checkpoint protein